jgi:hypothetical protein
MKDNVQTLGFAALIIGIGMLAFTFINAYLFLGADLGIVASSDLVGLFGEALAPLIATVIRVMYLGIMGWIGSLLTVRGIQLLTKRKREPPSAPKPKSKPEAELDAALRESKTPEKKTTKRRSARKAKGKKGE